MKLVLIIHPLNPDRPFVAMVRDEAEARQRFGTRASIFEAHDNEVFVVDRLASASAIKNTTGLTLTSGTQEKVLTLSGPMRSIPLREEDRIAPMDDINDGGPDNPAQFSNDNA